jgi:hypothetical protein
MTLNWPLFSGPPTITICQLRITTNKPKKLCMKNTLMNLTLSRLCLIIDTSRKQNQVYTKLLPICYKKVLTTSRVSEIIDTSQRVITKSNKTLWVGIGSKMSNLTVGSQFTTAKSGVSGVIQEVIQNKNGSFRVRLDVNGSDRWTTVK